MEPSPAYIVVGLIFPSERNNEYCSASPLALRTDVDGVLNCH